MSVDYDALLDALYDAFGIAAVFLSREGLRTDLVVVDKSEGVEIGGGPILTETKKPAVCVRGSELAAKGLDRGKMRDGRLTFNGASWNVQSTRPKPKPNGGGEFYLLLTERNDG